MICIEFVFLHRIKASPSVPLDALKDTLNASFVVASLECNESENKWKCTEPERNRMSDDLIELNEMEL